VLGILCCFFLYEWVSWNWNNWGRMLKPKAKKKEEIDLDDLLVRQSKAGEGDAENIMNPVFQARLALENDRAPREQALGTGAAGALGRLLRGARMSIGGGKKKGKAVGHKAQMDALDRSLEREAKISATSATSST